MGDNRSSYTGAVRGAREAAVIDVLHVVASSRGGGAVHMRDLAVGLGRKGLRCGVVMPLDGGNVRREDFEAAGLPFWPLDIASGLSLSALATLRRVAGGARLLHAHGARAALFARLAAASLGRSRPCVIYSLHGFAAPFYQEPRRSVQLAIERALSQWTDLAVVTCAAERQSYLEVCRIPAAKVAVLHNGINAGRFDIAVNAAAVRATLGIPADSLLFVTVCRLFKPRDFDTLLVAFRQVAQSTPMARLLVVGDGPLRPQIEHQVMSLGLGGSVTLAGWRQDTPALYRASDVFVLTTWGWEGLPLSVMEAQAAGLPVVATRAGGTPEIVVEGQTGYLVERRDAAGLGSALARLAGSRELRSEMGQAGHKLAHAEFGLDRMLAHAITLYARVQA